MQQNCRPGVKIRIFSGAIAAVLLGMGWGGLKVYAAPAMVYPPTRQTNQVDDYHGTQVIDAYRWLEDDNSPETKEWVQAQNKITFGYLEHLPERPVLKNRLTRLWNYERYGVPFREGGRYFLTKNDGLQNQSVLYTMDSLDAPPRVLLDPNRLAADGTAALTGYAVTRDGNYLAYGIASAGSDWQEWKVRDVRTGADLKDEVRWVKFSGASWTRDGKGFFYSRYDEPKADQQLKGVNYYQKLYFHRLGKPQSTDQLIYERPDHKDWLFGGSVTDDGRFLIIHVSQGTDTRNRVFYQDLQAPGSKVVELLNEFDAAYGFIDNDGPRFWFRTDLDAPRRRVIEIDIRKADRGHWKELIAQSPETLLGAEMLNHQFIGNYLKDAHSQIKIFSRQGRLIRELELPGLGTAAGFSGRRNDVETFYSFSSFTTPGTIYHCNLKNNTSTVFRQPKVECDSTQLETQQVFYQSKDGTRVPMFITHKKGIQLDGSHPTLLYGYGGFNISITPSFSVPHLAWLDLGGIYAVANLRGGGEYGEDWHQAGMKLKKQNVFDDFIAAAEWLIANHYTSAPKLAIEGRSNGGLLVGACMTQRPELFGAALPGVGVMDMLRFHKFTIGWAWTSDYGSADDAQYFNALYQYSPLHHLRPGVKYPPTLITTADHDDRVVPAHSFKFAARLQECQAGENPALIRIETRAGHGAGKPTAKQIEESADELAFVAHALKFNLDAPP